VIIKLGDHQVSGVVGIRPMDGGRWWLRVGRGVGGPFEMLVSPEDCVPHPEELAAELSKMGYLGLRWRYEYHVIKGEGNGVVATVGYEAAARWVAEHAGEERVVTCVTGGSIQSDQWLEAAKLLSPPED
jgi:hypothetical protein